jgi:hypothetical protein
MQSISLDLLQWCTISIFSESSQNLSERCMFTYLTLTIVYHSMEARPSHFSRTKIQLLPKIHHRLRGAFQEDVYTLSSVYKWGRAFKTGLKKVLNEHRSGRSRLDHIESKILSLFRQAKFHSVHTLTRALPLSFGTVDTRFGTDLHKKRSMPIGASIFCQSIRRDLLMNWRSFSDDQYWDFMHISQLCELVILIWWLSLIMLNGRRT